MLSVSTYNTFTLLAPAKLNLFLHITGQREDGYHLLQSLMVFVDVGDILEFSPYDGFLIDTEGPFSPALSNPHDNMVYKAAKLLAADYRVPLRGKIVLTKNLPIASGMGGGSADAAAALTGLSKLWGLPEDRARLEKIAQRLGADVPACLAKRTVWAEGVGEKMTHLPGLPDMHFVLLSPDVHTPTPEVFKRFQGRRSQPLQFMGRRKSTREWIADLKLYRNDLTDAAAGISPLIHKALDSIRATPNCHFSRLSGSGATCFGVYDTPQAAQGAANKLRAQHPDWWVSPANLLAQ